MQTIEVDPEQEYTNIERARRGGAILEVFRQQSQCVPPITCEGLAGLARFAVEAYATARQIPGPNEAAEQGPEEVAALLSDVAAYVLHHMDGAVSAPGLIVAALHLFDVQTGQRTPDMILPLGSEPADAVTFLTALGHAAVALDVEPQDALYDALSAFSAEAEEERFARAAQARTERLSA